jgi:hypothetical protein
VTVNIQENKLDRDIAIFNAHLEGLSNSVIGARNNLSSASVSLIINSLVKSILARAKLRAQPVPEQHDREARLNNKDTWSELMKWYVADIKNKEIITPTDPVIKIGVGEKFKEGLIAIGVKTVADLLTVMADKRSKAKIEKLQSYNAAAMQALERKIRAAGFDPDAGPHQAPNLLVGKC